MTPEKSNFAIAIFHKAHKACVYYINLISDQSYHYADLHVLSNNIETFWIIKFVERQTQIIQKEIVGYCGCIRYV